ncbi:Low affinity sulfate transporter 3 family protein [Dorcoceras hygrometricum]|uniref:Low affinity sulfate transporter 3 family protein n=1 Tax=Dorcoceras hygrometricum TaxID=472368 RepID=A0A2Z7CGJ6_9LAMI|nr:Low affinity sulfate transporter 3 family protein [Dorcoceras hygrometricum]
MTSHGLWSSSENTDPILNPELYPDRPRTIYQWLGYDIMRIMVLYEGYCGESFARNLRTNHPISRPDESHVAVAHWSNGNSIGISFSKIIVNSIRPRVEEIGKIPRADNVFCNLMEYPVATKIPGILIVRINSGTFCFANATFIRERILKLVKEENGTEENTKRGIRVLILDVTNVMNIDTSAIHALEELHRELISRGIQMAVTNPKWQVITKMKASKFVDKIGDGWIFLSVGDAVDASILYKMNALNNC